MNCYKYK